MKVAKPNNDKNPITSVTVVIRTPPETAGSIPYLSSISGKAAPQKQAISKLTTIATNITKPKLTS